MINSLWNWRKPIKHACSCHQWLLIWQDTVTLSRTNMFSPSWPSRTDMAVTLTTGYWLESLTPSDPQLGGGKQAWIVENLAHMSSMLRTATNFKPFSSLSRLFFRDCLVLIFISGTEAPNKSLSLLILWIYTCIQKGCCSLKIYSFINAKYPKAPKTDSIKCTKREWEI